MFSLKKILYQIDKIATAKLPYFPSMKVDTESLMLGAESDSSLPGISLSLTIAELSKTAVCRKKSLESDWIGG